jgi:hypothetical protein
MAGFEVITYGGFCVIAEALKQFITHGLIRFLVEAIPWAMETDGLD